MNKFTSMKGRKLQRTTGQAVQFKVQETLTEKDPVTGTPSFSNKGWELKARGLIVT